MNEINFNYLINDSSKGEFMDFLENDLQGGILELLNKDNLNILKKSKLKEERINYILSFSKYKKELFSNDNMIEILLDCSISEFYATIDLLDTDTLNKIIIHSLSNENTRKQAIAIYGYLNDDKKLEFLNLFKPYHEFYKYLVKCGPKVANRVLNEFNINLIEDNIDLEGLFNDGKLSYLKEVEARYHEYEPKENISISSDLLTKEVFEKLFVENDIYNLRKMLDNASYCTDISKINKLLKETEESIIISFNDDKLISPYDNLYNLIVEFVKIKNSENYEERKNSITLVRQIYNIIDKQKINLPMYMEKIKNDNDLNSIYGYLGELSNNSISDYIIDYHFEENYYNIMLDLQELLNMYYAGNLPMDDERLALYQKIFDIDNLSIEEKIELHNYLKDINMMEVFYDDMAFARKIVGEEIKNASLTKKELEKYEDKELTKAYGVPIYKVGEEPFFAIVKSGRHPTDELPTGHSFSLVGNGGISVYNDDNAYLYDAENLNPEQFIHIFPYDSYTLYRPFASVTSPTQYVNTLMMPDELVETNSKIYNELLILEQGMKHTGIDDKIPELKYIAKYCIDKITEKDVRDAQINGIGIMLVDSSKCKISDNKERGIYRHEIELGYQLNSKFRYYDFNNKADYIEHRNHR